MRDMMSFELRHIDIYLDVSVCIQKEIKIK